MTIRNSRTHALQQVKEELQQNEQTLQRATADRKDAELKLEYFERFTPAGANPEMISVMDITAHVNRLINMQIDKLDFDPATIVLTAEMVAEAVFIAGKPEHDQAIMEHLVKLAEKALAERWDPVVRVERMFPNDPAAQGEALLRHADLLEAASERMAPWAEKERAKGRPESELTFGNYLRETGVRKPDTVN
jgi:hypothetical protein